MKRFCRSGVPGGTRVGVGSTRVGTGSRSTFRSRSTLSSAAGRASGAWMRSAMRGGSAGMALGLAGGWGRFVATGWLQGR